jgi:hypothetical protein
VRTNFIPAANNACGVAVNGRYIYWANQSGPSGIGRARLDGIQVNPSFVKAVDGLCGLTIKAKYIFWAQFGLDDSGTGTTVGRANLDGLGAQKRWGQAVSR